MAIKNFPVINRELSWLSFNARVLQEAADPEVPLMERIRFLGIFSNNLDEFFRVRFATIRRMESLGYTNRELMGGTASEILQAIREKTGQQRTVFAGIYEQLLEELKEHNIYLLDEHSITDEQRDFVEQYFHEKVRPVITPIMVDHLEKLPTLNDKKIYLAVKLTRNGPPAKIRYAIMEIPANSLSRFLVLPDDNGRKCLLLLDDVIRCNLKDIFYIFKYDTIKAHTIKVTRDAELDIDDDVSSSFLEQVSKGLKKRKLGDAVRFIYDKNIPQDLLDFLTQRLSLTDKDSIVAGGRYHNFKDFMDFPDMGMKELRYARKKPLPHKLLKPYQAILPIIKEKDALLHYPYQSFHYFTDMLREAAIDPKVKSIKITVYRLAENSAVAGALINAARSGKDVTVVMELQARFDEESNIYWAKKLHQEGAKIIYGVKGLKVHSKLCLISRKEKNKLVHYANLGTGNYNESTAKIYGDESLFTADPRITGEVNKVFAFFDNNIRIGRYKHLLLAPFSLRKKLIKFINQEIRNAKEGKPAYIMLKVNSISDPEMIKRLYKAAASGVKVRVIVRGICSLIPDLPQFNGNLEAISIIDKYLEHSRIYVFCNNNEGRYYISSADWMARNLDYRIEVACPIYDPELREEIDNILSIQFADNTKARHLKGEQLNVYKMQKDGAPKVRAQEEIYNYLKSTAAVKPRESVTLQQ